MRVDDLLERFRDKRPDAESFDHLAGFVLTADPDRIEQFAFALLEVVPGGGTFLDLVLSHVSREGLARLADRAVTTLESASSEACESVLAYASLQYPRDLQRHLPRMFVLRPNAGSYYENWPWRGAADTDVSFLLWNLKSSQSACRLKAWKCLVETRRPDAISRAVAIADDIALEQPVESYLRAVGINTRYERLYVDHCGHIVFPPEYFAVDRPSWSSRSLHPTWRLAGDSRQLRFGGAGSAGCGLCGKTLHHLITLPSSSVFGDSSDTSTAQLEVCLSCLGWEQDCLFYRHSSDGSVQSLDVGSVQPEFVAEPLREACIRLTRTPERWTWQDWGYSNSRENLHRIGGHPCWIQSADFPDCKSCGETMHFLLQLDSGLPGADGGEWLWGSGGICYAFRCAACRITAFRWQCT
jgi:hypothetical protein